MGLRFLRRTKGLEWLAGCLLFLMLREWLLPLPALTDTADLSKFYYVAAGVLFLDLLIQWRSITFLIKLVGVLYLIHSNFFVTPFFGTEWLQDLYVRLAHDFPLLMQQNWLEMSLASRNILFYLLLVVLISLLSVLVLEQRQGLWFVFLTETYLATLDTFMPYDADGSIIRTLIIGFLLLAVIHLNTMEKHTPLAGRRRFAFWNSLLAPVLVISLTVGIAYAAPKQDASWPDPIAYLTGKNNGGTTYMKKVGYDNNDSRLGGPFLQDDSLVFIALTNEKTYWRGDSKDLYTGVGWQKNTREYEPILEPKDYTWKDMLFHDVEKKEVHASLNFSGTEKFPTIFYPGQLTKLTHYTPKNATLIYDKQNQQVEVRDGKIQLYQTSSADPAKTVTAPNTLLMKLNNYNVTAEVPILSEKKMLSMGSSYPESVKQQYLQLPANLPPRIRDLAKKVTANAKTPYEKVRAIEDYLRNSGQYKYETKDVPVPAQGQDFVDQFLFESQRGYCDHFSSAMAVMLRTIGVPTRWVKGFAPGTTIGTDNNGVDTVEVRNRDAHSWVEVYFPDTGWIPFEATSTFISPVRIKYDTVEQQQPAALPVPELGEHKPIDRGDGRLDELEGNESTGRGFKIPWETYPVMFILLAGAGFFVWRRRRQLMYWWLQRQMSIYEESRFTEKYQVLMRICERVLSSRREGETLREYVARLNVSGDKRQDLWYLTQLFERVHYGYKDVEERARTIANKIMDQLSQQLKP